MKPNLYLIDNIAKDLRHVFDKVDRDGNGRVNRTELRLALNFLCKQYDIDIKRVGMFLLLLLYCHIVIVHILNSNVIVNRT